MTHYLRHGSDESAACGFPVLAQSAPSGTSFTTRHDQATCGGCQAAGP
jgi:hypothetical protein